MNFSFFAREPQELNKEKLGYLNLALSAIDHEMTRISAILNFYPSLLREEAETISKAMREFDYVKAVQPNRCI